MKLAKALKLKNKKLKEYKSTLMKVVQNNSYDVDNKPIYNSYNLYMLAFDPNRISGRLMSLIIVSL